MIRCAAKYWTYQEMWDALKAWQAEYPNLMRVEAIGNSRDGRVMPAITLTNHENGESLHKSAILVDANIHAGEVSGNAVAMYWTAWCLEYYGNHPQATQLLNHHTVYIVPRIALDGAEMYLTTPYRHRSSAHTYPYSEPPEGFVQEDVNGDGYILQMRVPALDGGFAVDNVDPRVMRPRMPGEIDGTFYHVFPEGRIDKKSQSGPFPPFALAKNSRRSTMDFNRNFPVRWAGEHGQPGAGPYPLSEPELRALADFIHAHPNISAYAALHTSGGVILRQPSTGDDTVLSQTDRHLFSRVTEMGTRVSGYHGGSNYEKFATGHETVLMPGAADDWMYDHLGVLGFTVEIWDIDKRAKSRGYGDVGMRKVLARTPEEHTDDWRKIYAFASREVPNNGVFEWTPFVHSDFGHVEIGGINPKFVLQNPPLHLLEEECKNVSQFLTGLGLSTARLIIPSVQVSLVGPGLYRVVAEVSNAGFLPTSSTEKGKSLLIEALQATIQGPVEVVGGTSPTPLGHLDGYGNHTTYAPPKSQRAHVEWVVRAEEYAVVTVAFKGPRCGQIATTVTLI